MRENKVVYGLIGYGGMGRWHTEILSNVPEAVIGGIYDIKEEKREEAREGLLYMKQKKPCWQIRISMWF
ncbi:MAG: hypothetical protein ACLVAT_01935 [Lachnospiraceae bacterium]